MIRGSLLALLGLASFVAVYLAMAPGGSPPDQRAESGAPAEPPDATPTDAALAETGSINDASRRDVVRFELKPSAGASHRLLLDLVAREGRQVRNVTPPEITAGPKVSGPLTRVQPPEPEPEARVERLFSPIVVAAGVLKVRGRDIRLAGIAAPDFDQRCGEAAAAWPCGRMARAALRRFIRGRAIECRVPPGVEDIPDPATCSVAGDDIARWLVARGWAKRDGDLYDEEEDAARDAKLGLWGKGRQLDQAEVAAKG
jgi:endonuclease YncB( thermonuclease family)